MARRVRSTGMTIDAALTRQLYRRSGAERWALGEADFAAAIERSAGQRFAGAVPPAAELGQYLESLHLADVALACACARGSEPAWEHFVREYRPILLRIASHGQQADRARDVADSIYAELYGLDERDGARRSLFDYFHGRSTLAGWLKAVVAQRLVDKARAARRLEPLPDGEAAAPAAADRGEAAALELEPDRQRYLGLVRQALGAAIAGLGARDRLRLTLYYAQDMKLAAIGRVLGESEATASRKLERTRAGLRAAIERRLRDVDRLTDDEVAQCFDHARTDPVFESRAHAAAGRSVVAMVVAPEACPARAKAEAAPG